MRAMRSSVWTLILIFSLAVPAKWSVAQSYPNKPVRLLVGFAVGGNTDIIARLVAQKLALSLGQSFVVDNRGGAGGIIVAEIVARSAPDGYTLLVASAGHASNSALYKNLPYDALKDFAPISIVSFAPHVLAVNASMPVTAIKDLIVIARAKPRALNYGSGGVGSLTHLEGEFLKSAAHIDIVHIPYKGVAQALTDLVAGRVQLVFTSSVSALPFTKGGRVKIIGVTGSKRLSYAPDIPTIAESGLPEFVVDSSTGVLAPARTPQNIIARLNGAIVQFVKTPEMQAFMRDQGAEAIGSTPQEYRANIAEELARWKKVVQDGGIPVQDNWK